MSWLKMSLYLYSRSIVFSRPSQFYIYCMKVIHFQIIVYNKGTKLMTPHRIIYMMKSP